MTNSIVELKEGTPARYRVRKVGLQDVSDLLEWANDSDTRKNSVNQSRIAPTEHLLWFFKSRMDKSVSMFLVEEIISEEIAKKLFARFKSLGNGKFEVSVNMNPAFRGMGISSALLQEAIEFFVREKSGPVRLRAQVRHENAASQKLFQNLDFQSIGESDEYVFLGKTLF